MFILIFRERDEELDAIAHSAQGLLFRFKQLHYLIRDGDWVDELQIASLLALFVSDHFGGSDRGSIVERTRKDISGSNYRKPFVCTCSTGNSNSRSTKPVDEFLTDIVLSDLCEKSIRSIKERRNSIVVPLGALQFGVCRHRALLLKVICVSFCLDIIFIQKFWFLTVSFFIRLINCTLICVNAFSVVSM